MTEKTADGYRSNLLVFLTFISARNVRLQEIDSRELRDFLGYLRTVRHLKHKTIKGYFSAL
jgi:site-specific recombinase XerD